MLPDRYPDAVYTPGPEWKQGYDFFVGYANQNGGMGVVIHSAEGNMAGLGGVLHGPRQASWHLTFPKFGVPIQHYSLNAITWHCGRYGDDGGQVAGNGCLLGIECEGKAGEPLTKNQVARLTAFLEWYWKAKGLGEPSRPLTEQTFPTRSIPLILDDELWEHNQISATDCPSDRIPWRVLIEGMAVAEQPSEFERYVKLLQLELQYFDRPLELSYRLEALSVQLVAVWRHSDTEPALDHDIWKEVRALCQQMMAAIGDLHARCTIADRHK